MAPRMQQPWGDTRRSWYIYKGLQRNGIGDHDTLENSRRSVLELLRREIARLGGRGDRCFLGGLSQGCTVALDIYLRHGPELGLGGFVGSVGFVPSDSMGFKGVDQALRKFLEDPVQITRPLWLQCATDDGSDVPWNLVKTSVMPLDGRVPGLLVNKVRGRGHCVDDWEARWLCDFISKYAPGDASTASPP